METPIAFFIFRRPDTTRKVFEQIRKARPPKLFVVADGGRNETEWVVCKEARAVTENIDWPCEVLRNYADKNLGCKIRVSSGLDWVFQNTEEAIVLEDDTLPDLSFFRFAEELLEYYKDNQKIMHISGVNFQQQNKKFRLKESYYFSQVPHIWGWATWRRAWEKYDAGMKKWPEVKEQKLLRKIFTDPAVADYWEYRFSEVYQTIDDPYKDAWDAQWAFACILYGGLSVNPRANLISNVGFGDSATQTKKGKKERLANLTVFPMPFPLIHPERVSVNEAADAYSYQFVWGVNFTLRQKLISFLKFKFPVFYRVLKAIYQKTHLGG